MRESDLLQVPAAQWLELKETFLRLALDSRLARLIRTPNFTTSQFPSTKRPRKRVAPEKNVILNFILLTKTNIPLDKFPENGQYALQI